MPGARISSYPAHPKAPNVRLFIHLNFLLVEEHPVRSKGASPG